MKSALRNRQQIEAMEYGDYRPTETVGVVVMVTMKVHKQQTLATSCSFQRLKSQTNTRLNSCSVERYRTARRAVEIREA